jgi:hypothetical protein
MTLKREFRPRRETKYKMSPFNSTPNIVNNPFPVSRAKRIAELHKADSSRDANSIANELGTTTKQVKKELKRIAEREENGKGTTNILCCIQNKDGSYYIRESIRELLVNYYGSLFGVVAALLLSICYDGNDLIPLNYITLSLCHPDNQVRLQWGQRIDTSLSKVVRRHLENDCPFCFVHAHQVQGSRVYSCSYFSFGSEIEAKLLDLDVRDSRNVNVFTGLPHEITCAEPEFSHQGEIEKVQRLLLDQDLDYKDLLDRRMPNLLESINDLKLTGGHRAKLQTILNKLLYQPRPIYSSVENTDRLYPRGASVLSLHRELRSSLFEGFCQFDLKHAQLSIVAMLWNDPVLKALLEEGELWKRQVQMSGLDKDTLKKISYSLVFGSPLHSTVLNRFGKDRYDSAMESCQKSSLVRALSRGFSRHLTKVKNEKRCVDAFGVNLFDRPIKGKTKGPFYRSIIARQAQSYEIMIMTRVLNLLFQKGVPVWMFLHDGVIIPRDAEVFYDDCLQVAREAGAMHGIQIEMSREIL